MATESQYSGPDTDGATRKGAAMSPPMIWLIAPCDAWYRMMSPTSGPQQRGRGHADRHEYQRSADHPAPEGSWANSVRRLVKKFRAVADLR